MVTIGAETMRVSAALTVIRKKGFLSRLLCHRGGVRPFKHSWIWRFGKVHLLWRRNDDIYEVGRGAQLNSNAISSRSVSYSRSARSRRAKMAASCFLSWSPLLSRRARRSSGGRHTNGSQNLKCIRKDSLSWTRSWCLSSSLLGGYDCFIDF